MRRILLTGCLGGGKSTLLAALAARGHAVVAEPGRRVIAEARRDGTDALPWRDVAAFAGRALEMATADFAAVTARVTIFDRGTPDAALALGIEDLAGLPRYDDPVLVAPPWRAIFREEGDRRHCFAAAVAEHDRIVAALERLGHRLCVLPCAAVAKRVAVVEAALAPRREGRPPDGCAP